MKKMQSEKSGGFPAIGCMVAEVDILSFKKKGKSILSCFPLTWMDNGSRR
jgi:hypothetical protein